MSDYDKFLEDIVKKAQHKRDENKNRGFTLNNIHDVFMQDYPKLNCDRIREIIIKHLKQSYKSDKDLIECILSDVLREYREDV